MKAIVFSSYGTDALEVEEIEKPVPADDELLIKVRAAAVNPLDCFVRGRPYVLRMVFGLRRPKDTRLGRDVAGEVEAVGSSVTRFKPGDAVFGTCRGAFAEYACAPESSVVGKPDGVTFEQAASAPVAGYTALQGLRDKGRLRPGQRVLINGAAGGVGTFAVQIARWLGAEVTGVCSTRNVERVRSLGADHVVDYTRDDFTRNGRRYDVIFDLAGNHSIRAFKGVLNPEGVYVAAGVVGVRNKLSTMLPRVVAGPVLSRLTNQVFVVFVGKRSQADLTLLGELMREGKLTPVIDRRHGLSEVPEAIRYLEKGHARGKVVITLE